MKKKLYPFETYSFFRMGDMTALFLKQPDGHFQFTMIPSCMEEAIPVHRIDLNDTVGYRNNHLASGNDSTVAQPDNMAQLHVMHDAFGYNNVIRNGESANRQKFVRQERLENGEIETVFQDDRGIEFHQRISRRDGENFIVVTTSVTNGSGKEIELGLLESFTLGMLSPFHADDAPDSLKLHRWHSYWSAEGRQDSAFVEDYELAVSWTGNFQRGFRFGQRSSMVVKEFFPTVALEDVEAGVTWAVQLATVVPWQMTVSRNGDFLTLAGGLPDCDFANWRHKLRPGETFQGIPAVLTCVKGDPQDALNRLVEYPGIRAEAHPKSEENLPVVFNEFCTTWGCPSEEKLLPVIENLKGLGIRYFVMDAGWFRDIKIRKPGIGDWTVFEGNYPGTFDGLMNKIRENGMIPGIWFEFENVSEYSEVYKKHPDWLVHYEGELYRITADRYFLDFRKPEVVEYLRERVIDFLREHRIGYMKVDYNAKFHMADTPNGSLSDGTREVLESVRAFYLLLRKELPELVLEICASGGNRLSSEWMRIGDMASFSDCHETVSVPIIASQTVLQIPFESNQVWATLRMGEEKKRTIYQLAAGFIGRLCVSGDAFAFSDFQKESIRRASALYASSTDILKNGKSRVDHRLDSRKNEAPKGYQIFTRTSDKGKVVVLHTFDSSPKSLEIPAEGLKIQDVFSANGNVKIADGMLKFSMLEDFSGIVVVLRGA